MDDKEKEIDIQNNEDDIFIENSDNENTEKENSSKDDNYNENLNKINNYIVDSLNININNILEDERPKYKYIREDDEENNLNIKQINENEDIIRESINNYLYISANEDIL